MTTERETPAIPRDDWHEDYGTVLWWNDQHGEPPYVGTPDDKDFDAELYTHFTRIANPVFPRRSLEGKEPMSTEPNKDLSIDEVWAIVENLRTRLAKLQRSGTEGATAHAAQLAAIQSWRLSAGLTPEQDAALCELAKYRRASSSLGDPTPATTCLSPGHCQWASRGWCPKCEPITTTTARPSSLDALYEKPKYAIGEPTLTFGEALAEAQQVWRNDPDREGVSGEPTRCGCVGRCQELSAEAGAECALLRWCFADDTSLTPTLSTLYGQFPGATTGEPTDTERLAAHNWEVAMAYRGAWDLAEQRAKELEADAERWKKVVRLTQANSRRAYLGGGIILCSMDANEHDAAWASIQALDHENPRGVVWIKEGESLDAAIDATDAPPQEQR